MRIATSTFAGRAAIIEALPSSEAMRRHITERASAPVIKNQATTEGILLPPGESENILPLPSD